MVRLAELTTFVRKILNLTYEDTMDIMILADSKAFGALTQAKLVEGGAIRFREGHLPASHRTPQPVRDAVRQNPKGGRMLHGGIVYRWRHN